MHLLIFSPYYPPHTGGLENYTEELARHLGEKNTSVTIFTPRIPRSTPETETPGTNIAIIRFPAFEIVPGYPFPKFWTSAFWKLFHTLFQKDFDIVLAQTRFFYTSVIALVFAKLRKKPYINIEHGSAFVQLANPITTMFAKWYDLTLGRLVLRCADANIAISQAVQKFIQILDPKRTATVLYRGLDIKSLDEIPPDTELQKKFAEKHIIAYVGRLSEWKGVYNSILAMKSLPEDVKANSIFIVAGDGEDAEKLHRLADDSVVFLGNTSREKAIGLLKISDLYIHSALPGGGLSTSLLEAMLCRCAVIATPNEGAEEVIQDTRNGLLVSQSDPKLFQEKIVELLREKEKCSRLAEQARNTVLTSFDWNKNSLLLLEFLKKIR